MRFNLRLVLALIVIAGVFGPFGMSSSVLAQQSADITVTAEISSALTLTVCDNTADFGKGLTALGGTPTGTTDKIVVSGRGLGTFGQGTLYSWIPSCPAGQDLLTVESTVPWQLLNCATENTGSSSLSVAQADLAFARGILPGSPTYSQEIWARRPFSAVCDATGLVDLGDSGHFSYFIRYVLRVDLDETAGTFNSTTTWVVTA